MTIKMTNSHILSVAQIKEFLKVDAEIRFRAANKKEMYNWINKVLIRFQYTKLKKKDKGIVRGYIIKMTGLSGSQADRIIAKKKKYGKAFLSSTKRNSFPVKYIPKDIALLVKTDNVHRRLSGLATKTILGREHNLFKKEEYGNICNVSCSHIYNLREKRQYRSHSLTIKKTQAKQVPIGQRKKPQPEGNPGYLRVDTVHQGDLEKKKGIYHINIVDEITQWEVVGSVERISEYYLESLLRDLIEQIPFKIINFHSDNGSEFINKVVARLLNKMLINQTKSRSRHCNDNSLVEGKNGSVIRKNMGYCHIPWELAPAVNIFYKKYFNTYLNYHRPSGYATIITDKKGKQKKVYRPKDYCIPYERLKSLDNAEQYLKNGITFEMLDKIAYAKSDNDFAEEMQIFKEKLFKKFKHIPQEMISFATFISHAYVD